MCDQLNERLSAMSFPNSPVLGLFSLEFESGLERQTLEICSHICSFNNNSLRSFLLWLLGSWRAISHSDRREALPNTEFKEVEGQG